MFIFLFVLIAISLYKVKFTPQFFGRGYYEDYLSIAKTNSIKGIFICLVFLRHVVEYISLSNSYDAYFGLFNRGMFQLLVTLFLFYSGYGIMESIKKKGVSYIKTIPTKRVPSVLFRFDIALIPFIILWFFTQDRMFTIKEFLLSLIAWESLGNSNWYIFAILAEYLFTYFAFRFVSNKNTALEILIVETVIYIVLFITVFQNKSYVWYNTLFCYPLGVFWSLYGKKICKKINKSFITYITPFILLLVAFIVLWIYEFKTHDSLKSYMIEIIMNLLFTILFVMITMKVQLHNSVLQWLGTHLFELYILQRVPMIIFSKLGINDYNIYLYTAICFVATVILAWTFKPLVDKLWFKLIRV